MITVIVTTYNTEKYIARCLDSLINQTFQDFDIIIVDDCSKDNTQKIILEYADKFIEKIKYVFMPQNTGAPANTRNKALESGLITGKYIIFLDGDDDIENNFLEKLFITAENNEADITFCGYERFDAETLKVYCKEMTNNKYQYLEKKDFNDDLAFFNTAFWNKLIRYDFIKDFRFKNVCGVDDPLFMIDIYQYTKKLAFTNDILIRYRVYNSSTINVHLVLDEMKKFRYELVNIKQDYLKNNLIDIDILTLFVFIHIGISMPFRVYRNKLCNINEYIKLTKKYFDDNFSNWKNLKYLNLYYAFSKHGIKGLGLWGCRLLYKVGMFKLFLMFYLFLINRLNIDIKW